MGRMKPIAALLAAVAALVAGHPPQAFPFDGSRARQHDLTISADDFEGRKSGLEGGRKIEEYVADRFDDYGLKPAGVDGKWFQEFPLLVTEEKKGEMSLKDGPFGDVKFLLGDDFTLITNSGSRDVTAEVVLVGHGLSDEKRGWDDYGDVDVEGRIVLILRGTPDNGYDWSGADSRDSTLQEAALRGAAAVLWYRGERAVNGAAIHEGVYDPELPMAYVGKRVVSHLLRNTGFDLKEYQEKLKEGPLPLETGAVLRFDTEVDLKGEGKARNVIGMVEGDDPVLASEVIVVGAHMDHIGVNADGIVYNGANDNGSGTSVLLELARSFAEELPKPKRTILFMAFAAEEQGLLGSTYFTENPIVPLADIAVMFNLDMVGHGNGITGVGGGEYFPEMFEAFRSSLDEEVAGELKVGRAWGSGGSDHGPFRKKAVPVFNIWSEGEHQFYHDFEDDPEWISEEVLSSVGAVSEKLIAFTADWNEPLIPPRRTGYSYLYSSRQVDFDGLLPELPVPYLAATVRWYGAKRIGKHSFVLDISDMRAASEEVDSPMLVSSLGEAGKESREARHSVLIGVQGSVLEDLAEERIPLLGLFGVALARWPGFVPSTEDEARVQEVRQLFERIAEQDVALLIPPEEHWIDMIPEGARVYVRVFPTRGEYIHRPDKYPRKNVVFIISLDEYIDEAGVAEFLQTLGTNRVHLDLTPWLATGEERKVIQFLERLVDQFGMDDRIMREILGNNLFR